MVNKEKKVSEKAVRASVNFTDLLAELTESCNKYDIKIVSLVMKALSNYYYEKLQQVDPKGLPMVDDFFKDPVLYKQFSEMLDRSSTRVKQTVAFDESGNEVVVKREEL